MEIVRGKIKLSVDEVANINSMINTFIEHTKCTDKKDYRKQFKETLVTAIQDEYQVNYTIANLMANKVIRARTIKGVN